jgi:hypothetical protein
MPEAARCGAAELRAIEGLIPRQPDEAGAV